MRVNAKYHLKNNNGVITDFIETIRLDYEYINAYYFSFPFSNKSTLIRCQMTSNDVVILDSKSNDVTLAENRSKSKGSSLFFARSSGK